MQTKECCVCHLILPLTAFAKQKLGKFGRTSKCKKCKTQLYTRTKDGLVRTTYQAQVARTKKKNFPPITYSYEELKAWFWKQPEAETLYKNWVDSGYKTELRPSVDRLNDYKGYSLDNIQLVTFKQNVEKYYKDAMSGINAKMCKSVDQWTLSGEFIKTWPSIAIASRELHINKGNIRNAASHYKVIRKEKDGSTREYYVTQAGGFKWTYH